MQARMNNQEFLLDILNNSEHGPSCQVFVLEGIRHYAEIVAKTTPVNDPEKMLVINPVLWHAIAVDIETRFKARYAAELA